MMNDGHWMPHIVLTKILTFVYDMHKKNNNKNKNNEKRVMGITPLSLSALLKSNQLDSQWNNPNTIGATSAKSSIR